MSTVSRPPKPARIQPLLHDAIIAVRAPSQAWSQHDGDMGSTPITGIFHGDVRHVSNLTLTSDGHAPEWISAAYDGADRVVFVGLLRHAFDTGTDSLVRIERRRTVSAGSVREEITVTSRVPHTLTTALQLRVTPEFATLAEVKTGTATTRDFTASVEDSAAVATAGKAQFSVSSASADARLDDNEILLDWPVEVAPFSSTTVSWSISLSDDSLVVREPTTACTWDMSKTFDDVRISRWLTTALADLDALRLALPDHPEDDFYSAGAPWFLTLFGRDSLWSARLTLPFDTKRAASTLRVLARLQGTKDDVESVEQPGKILHELRSEPLDLPGEGLLLPPVYFGTVDATALWICLLADAWRAGMPEAEVRALLPTLRGALNWIVEYGDGDGDGFLDYVDTTGHGLANQGWKDSNDSIQWRDGALADGPIALCEVQGYAYEAVQAGADLYDHFDEPGAAELRTWAAQLKERFARSYWVETPEGRYPAVALDAHKRPVDTLTSNIGHLIGTGILDPADEASIAKLLVGPSMLSGYGLRTMSTGAAGYWPLSYHGGSVWTHDSAVVVHGMARAGLWDAALQISDGLLAAAEGFDYRLPELHAGDPSTESSRPVPYPSACRPQAWAAAAAVTVADVVTRAQENGVTSAPIA